MAFLPASLIQVGGWLPVMSDTCFEVSPILSLPIVSLSQTSILIIRPVFRSSFWPRVHSKFHVGVSVPEITGDWYFSLP